MRLHKKKATFGRVQARKQTNIKDFTRSREVLPACEKEGTTKKRGN